MRHLELIRRLMVATAATTDVDQLLVVALDVVCTHLDATAGVLWRPAPDGAWQPVAHHPAESETQAAPGADPGRRAAGPVPPVVAAMVATSTPSTLWLARSSTAGTGGAGHPEQAGAVAPATCAAALIQTLDGPTGVLQVTVADSDIDGRELLAVCETVAELLSQVVQRADDQARLAEARRHLEQELAYRSSHDVLTGLANRTTFQQRVEELLGATGVPWTTVVATVDVDRFAAVTGRLGSSAGDTLLRQIASRLRDALPEQATIARMAGDEFAVAVADDGGGPDRAVRLGRMIRAVFDDPFEVGEQRHRLDVSVGVATNPTGEESADQLLRDASHAVELAKTRGGGRCQLFDPDDHDANLRRLALEADLEQAVEHGDLQVVFQPVISLETGTVVGTEALARWQRPGHGSVSPTEFIPIAEDLGLAGRLGAQVLLAACEQTALWQRQIPEADGLGVAVNLSPLQLDDPRLTQTVDEALTRAGLAPDHLTLEITESALPSDAPGALARLWELRRRGIEIAIDDFGTGYSTLSRLRELPVDVLKIDRSFLQDADRDAPILQALFSMARTLGLRTIAEGVETPGQLQAVLRHDCQQAQGFLFARPLEPGAATRLLTDPTWDTDLQTAAEVDAAGAPVVLDLTTEPPGRLRSLLDAVHGAGAGEQVDELVTELLDAVAEATGMDSVYVTRIDFDTGQQHIEAAVNRGPIDIPEGLSAAWSDTICRRALADDREAIEDVTHSYPDLDIAAELGIATYLTAPIHTPTGGLHGTLCAVSSTPRDVDDHATDLLHHIARALTSHLTPATGHTTR